MGIGLPSRNRWQGRGSVVINGRSAERVEAAAKKIRASGAKGEVTTSTADLATQSRRGRFGCAGFRQWIFSSIILACTNPSHLSKSRTRIGCNIFQVNVLSGIRLSRAYLPGMKKQELGTHHFYFQRIGHQHSGGDDPLRHDQDGATGGLARPG